MKKITSLLLVLLLVFGLSACSQEPEAASEEEVEEVTEEVVEIAPPQIEEIRGVTVPDFAVMVNGIKVDNVMMADYPTYSMDATSVNSAGTVSTTNYVGFSITDIFDAASLSEDYIWMEAAADDGYTITLTGDMVTADSTLLAVSKNGEQFKTSPWLAPGDSQTTGDYLKGMVSILVNTSESAPEGIDNTMAEAGETAELSEEAPELADRTDKVTFEDFSFKVNGQEVTNETLEGQSIYKVSVNTESKDGSISEATYTGYKLIDVLAACGVSDYTSITAIANDGYEAELSEEQASSEYTIVAIEKDKETGEDGTIWLAPTLETSSNKYSKLVVEILAE
ncbi:MAG: hypothetical protein GX046_09690 [Tissierellia bacterium]|nr:hypothetical protein [Tissierellia bacterium]